MISDGIKQFRVFLPCNESFCLSTDVWHKWNCWELNFRFMNGILFICPWFHVLLLRWCHLGACFFLVYTKNVRKRKWCVFLHIHVRTNTDMRICAIVKIAYWVWRIVTLSFSLRLQSSSRMLFYHYGSIIAIEYLNGW